MEKMRIAVCISGFMRTWEYTKRSLMEKLGDVDFFIHTYRQNLYEFTANEPDKLLTNDDFSRLFDGMNVRKMIVEDRSETLPKMVEESKRLEKVSNYHLSQLESSDKNSISIPIGVRTYDHLRKVYLCNELRKEYEREMGIKYDLVMKTRFDIMYFTTPEWNKLNDGKLHFGYGATWGWPEDTICVCVPELMDFYAGRFKLFDEMYLNPDGTPKKDVGICSHGSLRYVIDKYGMMIGDPAVNINCFRSKNSMQYYGEYKFKCDCDWLYDTIKKVGLNDVKEVEQLKRNILG